MKYFVIAALLATAQAAETGCKVGLKAKVYRDEKCEKESHATVQAYHEDIEQTGKCVGATASAEELAKVVTAKKEVDAAKVVTHAAAEALAKADELPVNAEGKKEAVPKALT